MYTIVGLYNSKAIISDFVTAAEVDVVAVTESWHSISGDVAVRRDSLSSTDPYLRYMKRRHMVASLSIRLQKSPGCQKDLYTYNADYV